MTNELNKKKVVKRINDIQNEHLLKRHEGDECDQFANEAVADWMFILKEEIEDNSFDSNRVAELEEQLKQAAGVLEELLDDYIDRAQPLDSRVVKKVYETLNILSQGTEVEHETVQR